MLQEINIPQLLKTFFNSDTIMAALGISQKICYIMDLLHKSHNALSPNPSMYHFARDIGTCVHISVKKWCIVVYLSNSLWNLWNRQNVSQQRGRWNYDSLMSCAISFIAVIVDTYHTAICNTIWCDCYTLPLIYYATAFVVVEKHPDALSMRDKSMQNSVILVCITMTSCERGGVPKHWKLNCRK